VDDLHTDPSAAGAADLYRYHDQCFDPLLAATSEPGLGTADEGLLDLDGPGQRLTPRIDHRRPKLVQHHPRGLITGDPELSLQLHRRDPRRRRRHQVGTPEPQMQRHPSPVQHSARRRRGLPPTLSTLPQESFGDRPRLVMPAPRALEALRPARGHEILPARSFIREPLLELDDRSRKLGPAHAHRPYLRQPDKHDAHNVRQSAPGRDVMRITSRRLSAGEKGQPDLAIGIVAVGIHQADRLPRAKRRSTVQNGDRCVRRHERRQYVVPAVAE